MVDSPTIQHFHGKHLTVTELLWQTDDELVCDVPDDPTDNLCRHTHTLIAVTASEQVTHTMCEAHSHINAASYNKLSFLQFLMTSNKSAATYTVSQLK